MIRIAFFFAAIVAASFARLGAAEPADYTNIDPGKLGLKFIEPEKSPNTGFVVGGVNDTKLLAQLIELNGRKIEDLENDMRPGKLSTSGFLGAKENLLDILAADNKFVVDEKKLSHQQLARHLHILGALGMAHPGEEFLYHGRKFKVKVALSRGYQDSPFNDGTRTNADATIDNLMNGKTIEYSLLVPHMVERYGFYEGKSLKYRLEPAQVLEVLDFLGK